MPTYEFRNKDTGEIFEKVMKISQKEQYLADNPHVESWITVAPSMGDPVRLGVTKHDSGWKETLAKISERTSGGKALKDNSSVQF